MSQKIVESCDFCRKEYVRGEQTKGWWDALGKAIISFKDVPGCQIEVFKGDCCQDCANHLKDEFGKAIRALREKTGAPNDQ